VNQDPDSLLAGMGRIAEDYELQLQQSIPDSAEWEDIFTQKIRYRGAYHDIKNNIPFRYPDIIFTDSMKLECGDTVFEMICFGKSHSASDILIYVPGMKMLFTGDLLSKYGRPGFGSSSVADTNRMLRANRWINIRLNNIETIVDGHGEILTTDDLRMFSENLSLKYSSGSE
jgi:glyoxylase-like metal-dependent hydrolase (beta-lactamase superfamily II)